MTCATDLETLSATLERKIASLAMAKQPVHASPEWHEHIARQVTSSIDAKLRALSTDNDNGFYTSGRREFAKLKTPPPDNLTAVLQAVVILTGSSREYEDGTVDVSWAAVLDLLQGRVHHAASRACWASWSPTAPTRLGTSYGSSSRRRASTPPQSLTAPRSSSTSPRGCS